jgi:phage terminase small subunit
VAPKNETAFNKDGSLKETQHEKFCLEYLKDGNLTSAYYRAGYSPTARTTAGVMASRLFKNDNIQARIQALCASTCDRLGIEALAIIERYKAIGFSELGEFYDNNDDLLPIRDVPRRARLALKKRKTKKRIIREGENSGVEIEQEIEMYDPKPALDKLAFYAGLDMNALIQVAKEKGLTLIQSEEQSADANPDE